MSEFPLVTIVTETYRNFDGLFENIHSVLMQDYPRIEYIISDDGSGNFPIDEVKRYIENNKKKNIIDVIYIIADRNRGTVKSEGYAYKCASGEILMPLAGDDSFAGDDVVSLVVKTFQRTGCNILSTSRIVVDNDNNELYKLPLKKYITKIQKLDTAQKQYYALLKGMFYDMASGSVLYMKKEFFEKMGGYDERFILWEDAPFLLKILGKGEKIYTDYDINSIRYRTGGVSTGNCNPLYLKDKNLFNETLVYEHYSELPRNVKRFIDHNRRSSLCKSRSEKLKVYINDFDVMIQKIVYKLSDYIAKNVYKY